MTKIKIVENMLKTNPDAVIVGEPLENYCPRPSPFSNELSSGISVLTMEYVVAPKKGLYTINELQEFMDDLVPAEPDVKEKFYSAGEGIQLGRLYFLEKVGKMIETSVRTITTEEPKLVKLADLREKDKTIETTLSKTLAVYLYPDEVIARDNSECSKEYWNGTLYTKRKSWIGLKELKEYQPKRSLLDRVLGR